MKKNHINFMIIPWGVIANFLEVVERFAHCDAMGGCIIQEQNHKNKTQ